MSKYDRDSRDVYAVKRLGDEIGYGHLMAIAHELWARHLESKGLPRTGAFVAVSFPMVKEEYQAEVLNDPIYTIVVSKALDTADTPQTERGYMWTCPKCGTENHSDFKKCPCCGYAPQTETQNSNLIFEKGDTPQIMKEMSGTHKERIPYIEAEFKSADTPQIDYSGVQEEVLGRTLAIDCTWSEPNE